ncbi:DinB family protein [Paenibacillus sp. VCA1]|uniref:DinB family protein n=1 Tax=Paenibacillus sp. VCA1 TaxID=3039148 RepID=UPI002872139D|nr:DinB family protein [Paenibacillus sp. VCA1]MDR9853694.1 DinB family protein [Paenibacillus sp. VCA1]
MQLLFRYNWQVRDEWFQLLKRIPEEELIKERAGGMGSILRTLFHIVDVEQAWILLALQQLPGSHFKFEDYNNLDAIERLSYSCRAEVEVFVNNWSNELEENILDDFTFGEIMRHVIAHEIHHIGQLSVWIRELGFDPVSANVIGRELHSSGKH